jgi:hypothetical protein
MKNTLILVLTASIALLFNIEWEWHPSSASTITWGGPIGGIVLCAVICMVFIYRSFLAIQDFLIAKRYLTTRVTTKIGLLPWIVLLPLTVNYIARGDSWFFKWGESKWKFWYFITLLASIFLFQVYTVIRRVVQNVKRCA